MVKNKPEWYYKGKLFSDLVSSGEIDLEDYQGFVYVVTEEESGRKYIGKKFFWKPKILPVNSKRKRRKHTRVISDYETYFRYNEMLKVLVEEHGPSFYDRELLQLCKTKGECSYYESKLQFDNEVLLSDEYYNRIINCRINASHVASLHKNSN